MLCLGSLGMDRVISETCYKGTILQRNSRKMTINTHVHWTNLASGEFSYADNVCK